MLQCIFESSLYCIFAIEHDNNEWIVFVSDMDGAANKSVSGMVRCWVRRTSSLSQEEVSKLIIEKLGSMVDNGIYHYGNDLLFFDGWDFCPGFHNNILSFKEEIINFMRLRPEQSSGFLPESGFAGGSRTARRDLDGT
ncbi:hypothetical protein [Armatimonas sp.]|uniref:hypothetical protein n=1 Tax=Armatimonas sp. TaxID=1872638 RepID=UPI0037524427